jgi:hypothetical protein
MIASGVRRLCEKATSLENHNGDDTVTRCPGTKLSPNILVDGKAPALVATESECGGCAVAEERHKRNRSSIVSTHLQNTDETVDG